MKDFAKFEEIPSMSLEDIKETKRYGHTFVRSFVRSFGRTDNVKTVYPPTNTVCGGYKNCWKERKMDKTRKSALRGTYTPGWCPFLSINIF